LIISIIEELNTTSAEKIRLILFLINCWYSNDKEDIKHDLYILPHQMLEYLKNYLKDFIQRSTNKKYEDFYVKIKQSQSNYMFSDLELISVFLLGKNINKITFDDLSNILETTKSNYRVFLEIFFSIYSLSKATDLSEFKRRLLNYIIRQFVFAQTYNIPKKVLVDALELIVNTNEQTIKNILCAQRILEIHGSTCFLAIIKNISSNISEILITSFLLLFNSYAGTLSKRIIAENIKLNKYGLRIINNILLDSNTKPRGISLGIPWELYGSLENLLKWTKNAIIFFQKAYVYPPHRIVLLYKLLKSLKKALSISPQNIENISQLLDSTVIIIKAKSLADKFTSKLRKIYGYIPGFFRILKNLNKIYSSLSKRWEYYIIKNYPILLKKFGSLFTLSSLDNIASLPSNEEIANIIVILDGLRYDDFIMRLWPRLKRAGFKKIKIVPKISLLPSITHISRRAIIMGDIPVNMIFSRELRQKEEDLLKKRFSSIEYYYGPINLILNKFKKQEHHERNILLVLSELEKVMHGASEDIMVHFVEEYLDNIIELLMFILSNISKQTEKIHLTICSDHGLGIYIRYEEINDFIDDLHKKNLLDRSLEPIIKERYAIIPLSDENATFEAEQIYHSREGYRNKFWLVPADRLLFENIEFRRKGTQIFTTIKKASSVIVLFPKGPTKFTPGRGAVFHGGTSPEEMITAYGIFSFSAF